MNSTDPDGARAALLLLRGVGLEARAGDVPRPGEVGTLLVLVDDLDREGWDGVRRFVEAGGDLIVTAPFAPLAGDVRSTTRDFSLTPDGCDFPTLDRVAEIVVPVLRTFDGEGCLETASGPGLVVERVGDGRVMSIGSSHPWRNDALAEADHAALVVGSGQWGRGPLRILVRAPVGTGSRSLSELVPQWVWAVLAQLAVVAAVYAAWRAQRFGRPVTEAEAVHHDPLELVAASGRMTELSGAAEADRWAAEVLLDRWRAELFRRPGWRSDDVDDLARRWRLDDEEAEILRNSLAPAGEGQAFPLDPMVLATQIARARQVVAAADQTDPALEETSS